MQSAISAHERPARNALTVVVSCVNRTRKLVVDAARFSARPAFCFIRNSTQNLLTGNVESERGLKLAELRSDVQSFFQSVRVISCDSQDLALHT